MPNYQIEMIPSSAALEAAKRALAPDSFTEMDQMWYERQQGKEYSKPRVINIPFNEDGPVELTPNVEAEQQERIEAMKELWSMDIAQLRQLRDAAKTK